MTYSKLPFSGRPVDYQNIPVTNGEAFWPDLNLAEFQQQRALPVNMDPGVMLIALLAAIQEANDALVDVVARNKGKGYAAAVDVPGPSAEGENALTAQYKIAVYARAKADLMGEFQTIGRRNTHPGQEGEDTRESLLAEAALVMRNMKGYGRVGVYKI
ncbi:head completion/stabilization protein [Enterobacter sp. WCHEn045836]|uniref:head completion/stabilization protein n=1 Tax=Enterobacter sp. WCHEn045836 TaxID=2497434 RepID=UPI000F82833D|nr:head completion/stabilization protein [Enterobacter sp. WCHEn045836]RTP98381.1 head completion/stabilization protein [Enterobacter sp. WCHEn045836]